MDSTSRQANEDVLKGNRAVCYSQHCRIFLMFSDQLGGCPDGKQSPVIDDRHPITHRLGFLHGVGGEKDATAFGPQPLDPVP